MSRLIPKWIGSVKTPENRETTIQLLFCWAQLLNEVTNVKQLLRKLESMDKAQDIEFVTQASEVSMHLSKVMEERKLVPKANTDIYTGNPTNIVGYFNSRTAGVLHHFFDDPNYKPRKPCIPCKGEI